MFARKVNKYYATTLFVLSIFMGAFLNNFFIKALCIFVGSVSSFMVVMQLPFKSSPIALFCRKSSTVIYFIHLLVWTILYLLLWGQKTYGFIPFTLTFIISFVVSVLYYFLGRARNSKRVLATDENQKF